MRRWLLSKKDRKRLQRRLEEQYPRLGLSGVERVEVVVEGPVRLYVFDSIPAFIEDEQALGERLVPHLIYLLRRGYSWLPAVVVDEGAVRPISRGADLMRPGVLEARGSFAAGDVVVITEPTRGLPLAVHEALLGSDELLTAQRGRVAKSLHHVGDRYWKLGESL